MESSLRKKCCALKQVESGQSNDLGKVERCIHTCGFRTVQGGSVSQEKGRIVWLSSPAEVSSSRASCANN